MDIKKVAYISGFLKKAQALGCSKEQAIELYKQADGGGDPAALQAAMQGGAGGPPPMPPQGDPSQGAGLPPPPAPGTPATANPELAQLEQALQALPPEQLEAVIQQIAQMMQGGGDQGAGGPPPGAGGPPPGMDPSQGAGGPPPGMDPSQLKQGSANDQLVAKQADYISAFIGRAIDYGYTKRDAEVIYKQALAQFDAPTSEVTNDKEAIYLDSFVKRASELGFTKEQALNLYQSNVQN